MSTMNQKEILAKIKEEICRVHPVLNPRKNNKLDEATVMEIYFTFGATYDNKPIMAIGFLDGNESSRSATSTFFELEQYINLEVINQLISYLITEYPQISDLSISPLSFSLDFEYFSEMKKQKGISCDKIILEFQVYDNEFRPILNQYLANILVSFTNELAQTQTYKYKYEEYCNNLKSNILASLSEKEVEQMIKLLPIEVKRELLQKLSSQYFIQFYQENCYDDKAKEKQLREIQLPL